MSLSVMVPYVPLQMVFLALNLRNTDFHPYDYHMIHEAASPYPWSAIMLVPSWMLPFEVMNQPWIAIFTTIPIVLFFGMTKDAIEMYRKYTLAVGLGKFFPVLNEPWDPDRPRQQTGTSESKRRLFGSLATMGRRGNTSENVNLEFNLE
jgi:pheromone a factor receptor